MKMCVSIIVGIIVGLFVDFISRQLGCTITIGGDLVAACYSAVGTYQFLKTPAQ
jgi:hypothetical protein